MACLACLQLWKYRVKKYLQKESFIGSLFTNKRILFDGTWYFSLWNALMLYVEPGHLIEEPKVKQK